MWQTAGILAIILVIVGIIVYFKKEEGNKITIWNKTYPIEIENEFGEVRSSYVEYWITKNDITGELKFHYSGKYAKAHQGYNYSYDYYLKLIANETSNKAGI